MPVPLPVHARVWPLPDFNGQKTAELTIAIAPDAMLFFVIFCDTYLRSLRTSEKGYDEAIPPKLDDGLVGCLYFRPAFARAAGEGAG